MSAGVRMPAGPTGPTSHVTLPKYGVHRYDTSRPATRTTGDGYSGAQVLVVGGGTLLQESDATKIDTADDTNASMMAFGELEFSRQTGATVEIVFRAGTATSARPMVGLIARQGLGSGVDRNDKRMSVCFYATGSTSVFYSRYGTSAISAIVTTPGSWYRAVYKEGGNDGSTFELHALPDGLEANWWTIDGSAQIRTIQQGVAFPSDALVMPAASTPVAAIRITEV